MPPNKKEPSIKEALKEINLTICKSILKLVISLPLVLEIVFAKSDEVFYLSLVGWILVVSLLFFELLNKKFSQVHNPV